MLLHLNLAGFIFYKVFQILIINGLVYLGFNFSALKDQYVFYRMKKPSPSPLACLFLYG